MANKCTTAFLCTNGRNITVEHDCNSIPADPCERFGWLTSSSNPGLTTGGSGPVSLIRRNTYTDDNAAPMWAKLVAVAIIAFIIYKVAK